MIRVLVNGARGRMGAVAVSAVKESGDLILAGVGLRSDDLDSLLRTTGAEVLVDFTSAEAAFESALRCVARRVHPVIGTTGMPEARLQELAERCREARLGGLLVPNFSLGAVLMMRLAAEAARFFPEVEIIEAHHPGKKDAPSGTALLTARVIDAARRTPATQPASAGPARGERRDGVPLHSIRLPGLIAEQEVRFGAVGQTLSIQHVTYSREAFAPGIVLACRSVQRLDRLEVGLETLLFPRA